MNIGQVIEMLLGWSGYKMGLKYACPVFEGPKEDALKEAMIASGMNPSGKVKLMMEERESLSKMKLP